MPLFMIVRSVLVIVQCKTTRGYPYVYSEEER